MSAMVGINIISASLAIRIAERSSIVMEHSSSPSVRTCGKTADWIRMPFGVVSGVGLGMGVLDFGGDRRRGRGSLGVNWLRLSCVLWQNG